jgi:hypothetical protein
LSFTAGYAVHFFPCISTNQPRMHKCTSVNRSCQMFREKTRHIY